VTCPAAGSPQGLVRLVKIAARDNLAALANLGHVVPRLQYQCLVMGRNRYRNVIQRRVDNEITVSSFECNVYDSVCAAINFSHKVVTFAMFMGVYLLLAHKTECSELHD
jgi:hypothetical protein